MNIPQVLGYTRIAGTPVVTGLYTVLLPLVAFAVFGSSRHLVVAADSATAAIFSSSLSHMAPLGQREIYGAGRHADAADRGPLAPGAGLQAGLPRRFPVAHGAGRVSDRRRDSGRHRDARRHARRRRHLAPHAWPAWEVCGGAVARCAERRPCRSSSAASILLGRRFAPRFPVSLVVVVGTIAASAWFRSVANTASRSSARSPADCRRSNGRT